MKYLLPLLLLTMIAPVWADAPAPKPATPPPASANAPAAAGTKLDDYLKDLADTLKLNDDQKKQIADLYFKDASVLQQFFDDDKTTAFEKNQAEEELRKVRNNRILALLTPEQQAAFPAVEDKYRVPLIQLALTQGWPTQAQNPPAAAPARTPAPPAK